MVVRSETNPPKKNGWTPNRVTDNCLVVTDTPTIDHLNVQRQIMHIAIHTHIYIYIMKYYKPVEILYILYIYILDI